MKVQRTPQEKKRLSYEKDCRNNYGQNDKASRKAIRRRKKWVNHSYRRTIKQTLKAAIKNADPEFENVRNKVKSVKRKFWKKLADAPLGEHLKRKEEARK